MHSPEKPSTMRASPAVSGAGADELQDTHSDIFFAAVETTRMPMIVTDPHQADNPMIFVNNAFQAMSGYSREELVGSNCRFLQGPETSRETVAEIRAAIRDRKQYATEILNYRKDGSTFWNALFISPVFDGAGNLVYFFGSQLDVSRRRDAEQALYQAQKMESLGQLTGGIAHDFNNLLQVISGFTDTILAVVEKPEVNVFRLKRSADAIRLATDRAAKLTHQLLAFARKQRLEGRLIKLNALIDGMSDIADSTFGDAVTITRDLSEDLWNARIDPTQVEVALLNIFINARDAMPNGGTVSIKTGNVVVGADEGWSLQSGRYVCVSVTDTGSGMAPDVLARVMEPFFTTKGESNGTGLGLAMVYGFAKQSGGTVRIESDVGQGTTVSLFFPATEQVLTSPQPEAKRPTDRGGSETILVVDDRPDVADIARTILEDYGYSVHVAIEPAAALKLIDDGLAVDLLLTDLVMPGGMNGVMLAWAARQRNPAMKVLLTTGYADASLERTDAGGSEFDIIHKPYRRADLARHVRYLLDGPTGIS